MNNACTRGFLWFLYNNIITLLSDLTSFLILSTVFRLISQRKTSQGIVTEYFTLRRTLPSIVNMNASPPEEVRKRRIIEGGKECLVARK